jgi:hypothetical protein
VTEELFPPRPGVSPGHLIRRGLEALEWAARSDDPDAWQGRPGYSGRRQGLRRTRLTPWSCLEASQAVSEPKDKMSIHAIRAGLVKDKMSLMRH